MRRLILILSLFAAPAAFAQESPPQASQSEPAMTYERLGRIIFALDPDAKPSGDVFEMHVAGRQVIVVTDRNADRMRAMVPIREAQDISDAEMRRMMQANFDSALDARYAVANGILWAAFIHPLSPLEREQFIYALIQTVTAAETYGTLYTGGGAQFGHGDSGVLQQEVIDELLKRGEAL